MTADVSGAPTRSGDQEGDEPGLDGAGRRRLALLALPTLGFALCSTVLTTYLPVVVSRFEDSPVATGALIAFEGVFALTVPPAAGARSDTLRTRIGGRLPFLLAGAPLMALALIALGFIGAFLGALALVGVFFFAYYLAYEPYRALYPDLVREAVEGRAQSGQAIARGFGTGLALGGGGLLLSIGQAAPFAAAAGVMLLTTGLFTHLLLRRTGVPRQAAPDDPTHGLGAYVAFVALLRERPPLRRYLLANALWEGSLGAIKTFVVLWVTEGVGLSLSGAAGVIGAVAIVILIGAASSGALGDRYGRARVMSLAALGFGAPMLVPFLTPEPLLILIVMPVVAFSGGVVMSLPYALLTPMMRDGEHGLFTGFYSLTRGLGLMVGPLLAGVAITISRAFDSPFGTNGYSAVWLAAGLMLVASVPVVRGLRPAVGD